MTVVSEVHTKAGTLVAETEHLVAEFPYLLLRIAGFPARYLDPFRSPDLAEEALRWWTEYERLVREAGELKAILYRLVPELGPTGRRAIINVQRALGSIEGFAAFDLTRTEPFVAPEVYTRLKDLRFDCATQRQRRADFQALIMAVLREGRLALRDILPDDLYRKGLALSSLSLSQKVGGYLRHSPDELTRRDLKAEESLLSYLARAAGKTSPFSTFTFTALGRLAASNTGPVDLRLAERVTKVEINRIISERALSRLASVPSVRSGLMLQLGTSVSETEDALEFIVHRPDLDRAGGGCFPVEERKIRVPSSPAVQKLVGTLRERPRTFAEVVAELAPAGSGREREVEAFIWRTVEMGLIMARPPVSELATNFGMEVLKWLLQKLTRHDHPVGAALGRLMDAVRHFESASGAERPRARLSLEAHLRDLEAAVDLPHFDHLAIVEDVGLSGSPIEVPEHHLEAYLCDLDRFARLSACFDQLHLRRQQLRRFMEKQGCEKIGLLELYVRYRRHFQQGTPGAAGEPRSPATLETETILGFQESLRQAVRAAVVVRGDDRIVAADRLTPLLDKIPAPIEPARSGAFFLQKGARSGDPVVLNLIVGGYCKYFSRFLDLVGTGPDAEDGDTISAALYRELQDLARDGEVIADLGVVAGANVNAHPTFTPYCLRYPGVNPPVDESRLIALEDLSVVLDDDGFPTLLWERRGVSVRPVHLGFLIPQWLPDLAQFLLHFSPPSPRPLPWHEIIVPDSVDSGETPRMYFGSLLLYRRGWHFAPEDLPLQPGAEDDVEAYLRLTAWRAEKGLPDGGFITLDQFTSGREQDFAERVQADERSFKRKPQYVNFTHPIFLPRIRRLFSLAEKKLTLWEVYPDLGSTLVCVDGDPHVCEILLQRRL